VIAMREARARHMGVATQGAYTDLDTVRQEVRDAHRIMSAQGWQTIDASYMAIEEIARDVMRLRGLPERSLG
jgi:regulator of PEP synthase PpsR (kinase-PPPase family)